MAILRQRPASPAAPAPRKRPQLVRHRAARILYLVGASGSGKSHALRELVRTHRGRALVWDFKDDHPELPTAHSIRELCALVKKQRRLRYLPDMTGRDSVDRQFEFFCRVAWALQSNDPSIEMLLAVEEGSEVTKPSWAPPWWRRIIVQGRAYNFTPVMTTQRPAYVDKSFTSNATLIRCGRLGDLIDARVMGQRINVLPELIQRLPDRAAYVYDGSKTLLSAP